MWKELKRVIKPNGAIALFGSQPFTSVLVMSNPEWFRREWIWEKSVPSGYLDANRYPLKAHENILVFASGLPLYIPQMTKVKPRKVKRTSVSSQYNRHGLDKWITDNRGEAYPRSVIYSAKEQGAVHPTQKPVDLLQYLIRTYTNKEDTVLDFCMGSGSTGVACVLEERSFIGIEQDATYFEIAQKRIHEAQTTPRTLAMELTA